MDDLIWLLEQPDVLNEKRWTIVSGLCYLLLVGLEDLDEGTLPLEERRRQTDEALQIREALRSRRPLLLENYFAEDCREDDEECLGEDLWFVLRFLDDPTGFIM